MAETICTKCETPIEGFTVYDGDMNTYHPGCVPAEFKEQAKAERKQARKGHVGVRKQRKIDGLWNRRARKVKKADALAVEASKIEKEIEEIDTELKGLDPKFGEKMVELTEQKEGEVLA